MFINNLSSPCFALLMKSPGGWGASARGVVTSYTGDRVSQIPDPQLLESSTLVKWWSMHLQLCQTPDSSMAMTHCRVNEFCVFFFCSFLPHLQFLTQSVIPQFLKSDGLVHFTDVRPLGFTASPTGCLFHNIKFISHSTVAPHGVFLAIMPIVFAGHYHYIVIQNESDPDITSA